MKTEFCQFLIKFLEGQNEIDPDNIVNDIRLLLYTIAKKNNRSFSEDDMSDLVSEFVLNAWEINRPVNDPHCYMNHLAKKLIFTSNNEHSKVVFREEKLPVSDISNINPFDITSSVIKSKLPSRFKEKYIEIVHRFNTCDIVDVVESGTFLGDIIVSSLMSLNNNTQVPKILENFKINSQQEEILLAVVLMKLKKKWSIPFYIFLGPKFFISIFSFGGIIFAPGLKKYFRNIFLSVQIYCAMERVMKSQGYNESMSIVSKKFNSRKRDVDVRYRRVKKILERYNEYINKCIRRIVKDKKICGITEEITNKDNRRRFDYGNV